MAYFLKLCQFSAPAALIGMNLRAASEKRGEKWNLLLLLSLELLVVTSDLYSEKEV